MDDNELLRYSRHILLPQIDIAGQERICAASVLIVGLGGLGSPAAMYLASSGVGELILVDDDSVDLSNLQRQIIHRQDTIGEKKVLSAARQIRSLNSAVQTVAIDYRLEASALKEKVAEATIVLDCSDNFPTRKLINRICHQQKTPLVSGAAIRLEGQITVFDFRDDNSPCYQCLYDIEDAEDLSCSRNGVLY